MNQSPSLLVSIGSGLFLLALLTTSCKTLATSKQKGLDSPYGVLAFLSWNDAWNSFMYPKDKAVKAMDLIQASGVKWVRLDLPWNRLQPDENKPIDYAYFDWLVKELQDRDLQILGLLGYCPDWASSTGQWNGPPKDIEVFASYVKDTVAHYKDQIDYWEIWNEPNLEIYWVPQDGLKTYAKLLEASYKAAKQANPGSIILNGGLAMNSYHELRRFYALGTKDYFDIANVHLFIGETTPNLGQDLANAIRHQRGVMAGQGDADKELWITEFGVAGIPQEIINANPTLSGKPNEKRQAELLEETMTAATAPGLADKIFWAFFQDTNNYFHGHLDYLGLIRKDFTEKPAYKALQKLVN